MRRVSVTIKTHPEPIWRDRANFLIRAPYEGPHVDMNAVEQLWARQVDEQRFEICCIPYIIYDVNLGDLVETDETYTLVRVLEDSGHYAFRIWFTGHSEDERSEVCSALESANAGLEWCSQNVLAVDAVDRLQAERISGMLVDYQSLGFLHYETGRTREPGAT